MRMFRWSIIFFPVFKVKQQQLKKKSHFGCHHFVNLIIHQLLLFERNMYQFHWNELLISCTSVMLEDVCNNEACSFLLYSIFYPLPPQEKKKKSPRINFCCYGSTHSENWRMCFQLVDWVLICLVCSLCWWICLGCVIRHQLIFNSSERCRVQERDGRMRIYVVVVVVVGEQWGLV